METYINNKKDYLNLKLAFKSGGSNDSIKNETKKYAVVMLCMLRSHYVLGACISAFAHKFILKRKNITDVDLVIMCDDVIYENHGDLLRKYFDIVEKININE